MVLFNKKWTTELEVTIKDFISTAVGCVAELLKNRYDVPAVITTHQILMSGDHSILTNFSCFHYKISYAKDNDWWQHEMK